MSSTRLAQYYVLETYSRAEAIKGQCEHLLTYEYASEAPKNLAKCLIGLNSFFQKIARLIYNDIEESLIDLPEDELAKTLSPLKLLDKLIIRVGEHVQYIDSARRERVPWSIIPAFEDFAEDLLGKVEVMFCPLWEYNYQIITDDLKEYYLNLIKIFSNIPGFDLELAKEHISSLKKPFHIIRFPSPERLNIRLHANIGHELGHKLAAKFFTPERKDRFANSILDSVNLFIEENVKDGKIPEGALLKLNVRQNYIEKAAIIWERALSEILSDLTACILFGPAPLFSMYDFALQDELDHKPTEQISFYPPWRYRLREAFNLLESYDEKFFPIPKEATLIGNILENGRLVADYYSYIKSLIENENDLALIKSEPIVNIVYENLNAWIKEGVTFLLDDQNLKKSQLTPSKLYKKLPYLVERLENNILPNALEKNINNRMPADFAEIVNTAWYFWLSKSRVIIDTEGNLADNIYQERINMNKLCLKAVEYAHLEQCYTTECCRETPTD